MTATRLYNIVTGIFLLLSALVVIFVITRLMQAPQAQGVDVSRLPTEVPTLTPTFTHTPTNTSPPPSWTPTFTPTDTPTETHTPTLTPTASATITDTPGPTLTPSLTFTPSASPTFTATFTPEGPTPTFTPSVSPFLFALRDPVNFVANFANPSAGCAWQGIGGQVRDLNGNEITGNFQVRVFNSEIDRTVAIGTNSLYGPVSGWEVVVDSAVNNKLYFVQLETASQRPTVISPRIDVVFPGTCDRNAAIITFIQTRPF